LRFTNHFAAAALCVSLALTGCTGASQNSDIAAKKDAAGGVWASISKTGADSYSVALRGEKIANQDVRWGLVTMEKAAVATGKATTDATGKFSISAKPGLAVVVVVEHDQWSAWVNLPK
jgi:hypothetical protein